MPLLSASDFVDVDFYRSAQRAIFSWMMITLLLAGISMAQALDPDGGSPPFITSIKGPLDQFNLPSGNILIQLPVRSKAGKYPTSYSLVGNSHAFIGPPPQNSTDLGAWYVSSGFTGALSGAPLAENAGAAAHSTNVYSLSPCNNFPDTMYANWVVVEPNGTEHAFSQPGQSAPMVDIDGCVSTSASGTTVDGSGYTLKVQAVNKSLQISLWDKSGNLLQAPTLPTSCNGVLECATDSDGTSIYGPIISGASGAVVDTLGQTIINATLNHTTGTAWLDEYQYTDVSSNAQQVNINYTLMGLHTNFGCTWYQDVSLSGDTLPTSIAYPDGETVQLSYESIPLPSSPVWGANFFYYPGSTIVDSNHNVETTNTGGTSGGSHPTWKTVVGGQTVDGTITWTNYGNISTTGRVASITYPQGGSVSYSYSGSFCPGGTHTITRTVNDNNGNSSPSTYQFTYTTYSQNPNVILTQTVTETDPTGNVTILYYGGGCNSQGVCGASTAPTQILRYQGAVSTSNLIAEQIICYNGNNSTASGCVNPKPGAAPPFYQVDTYSYLIGPNGTLGSANDVQVKYDSYGNVTSNATYDYGVAFPPSGTPLSTTATAYNTGSSCGTLAIAAMRDRPCSITVTSSSGKVSQVNYAYNAAGHPITTSQWVSGSTYLSSSATYNANGTLKTSTDVGGTVTTYSYGGTGGCNGLLPTSIVVGGLTMTETWNCSGGVLTSKTDFTSVAAQYGFVDKNGVADPMWRLRSTTDGLNNVTWTTYSPGGTIPATSESSMVFGSSTTDKLTTFDGLARPILQQTAQAIGSANFDTTSIAYDLNGRQSSIGVPCVSTASAGCSSAATITTYDALGRPTSVTDGGGGNTTYTYTKNDVLSVLGPAPAGENVRQNQTQYDGMGRPTSVCNISTTVTGNTSCSQNNGSYSGVVTTTSYAGETVSSTRGSQTRSTTVDGLGRVTVKTTPEGGTWYYYFDTPNCNYSAASPGNMTCSVDPNGITTLYFYDGLNRLTAANAVTSYCRMFQYDTGTSGILGSRPSGITLANTSGRLVEATTVSAPCTSPLSGITDEWFSYDAEGRLTDVWELTPHSGSYYHTSATYYANGEVASVSGVPGVNGVTYGIDGEGRPNSASFGTTSIIYTAVINGITTGVTYNAASQPTNIPNMQADSDVYLYDAAGRMKSYTFTVNGVSSTSTLSWNPNGTLGNLGVVDNITPSESQTCKFGDPVGPPKVPGYDDLGRLISDNCTPMWSQNFTYDQYDNITKSGSISWNPGYNPANNQYSSIGATYDPSGNLTYDSFNTYTWDGYQKVASVDPGHSQASCGSSGWCLTNDALGRIVEVNASGSYTEILYSPIGKTAIMSGQTATKVWYPMPGGGTVLASSTNWPHYQHKDWLGSGRLQTEFSGTLGNSARTVDYDRSFAPYGEMYGSTGNDAYDLDFTGDVKTMWSSGLLDTENREYHPNQGRWISPDPAGTGWNQYAYPTNPNSATDPTGLFCAYLNDAGNGVQEIDDDPGAQASCGDNGGYWIAGSYGGGSQVRADADSGTVTGIGYDSNGNPELSRAGAKGTSTWGAWTQNFGTGPALAMMNAANNPDLPTLDNRANALAQALRNTHVQTIKNPCTIGAFYVASTTVVAIPVASVSSVAGVSTGVTVTGIGAAEGGGAAAVEAGAGYFPGLLEASQTAGKWFAAGGAAASSAWDWVKQKVSAGCNANINW